MRQLHTDVKNENCIWRLLSQGRRGQIEVMFMSVLDLDSVYCKHQNKHKNSVKTHKKY